MKRLLPTLSVALLLALNIAACSGTSGDSPSPDATENSNVTSSGEQIANPWVDCDSLEDAADIAGFSIDVPDSLDGYEGRSIQATKDDMIQVVYGDASSSDAPVAYVRKAAGEGKDISGDYNEYAHEAGINVDGTDYCILVTVRGNDDGSWRCATWSRDGYSYSINSTNGMDNDAVTSLVSQVV